MTVSARHVTDEPVEPGEFKYYVRRFGGPIAGMTFMCPCSCGHKDSIPFVLWRDRPVWEWDGNEDQPTLHPSLNNPDGCKWHGWLRAGQWESC